MAMAMITLEDLEGQIDAVVFAETLAEVTKKYDGCVAMEKIVFVRGKVDRRRETPSVIVSEVIPVEDSVARLTTAVALKLEPTRHAAKEVAELEAVLRRHKGNTEVFLRVSTGPEKKVVMRLDRERSVRPTPELVDELEQLLGGGTVQLCGAGTRRKKRLEERKQPPLFQEVEPAAAGDPTEATSDEQAEALLLGESDGDT
jgi:DNA polymerase-3 subunit alpha